MSNQKSWDIGDAEPLLVDTVLSKDERTFIRGKNGEGWKLNKMDARTYQDWESLVRYMGPLTAIEDDEYGS